jgi:hypothetical protein
MIGNGVELFRIGDIVKIAQKKTAEEFRRLGKIYTFLKDRLK